MFLLSPLVNLPYFLTNLKQSQYQLLRGALMKFSKFIKSERGFTLIEMMIVLMIISILLLIAIPNMTSNNKVANDRGCDATIDLLQAQVGAYYVENKKYPENLEALKDKFVDTIECPNGTKLILDENRKVVKLE